VIGLLRLKSFQELKSVKATFKNSLNVFKEAALFLSLD
jgi:hypothetical protein